MKRLTHWGRVTHICVSKLTIIGSDNGLSPDPHQAIIWTNAGLLLIGPLGTNFSEILIEILTFSSKKMRLKVSSAKRRPFCPGLNVLTHLRTLGADPEMNVICQEFAFRLGFVCLEEKEGYDNNLVVQLKRGLFLFLPNPHKLHPIDMGCNLWFDSLLYILLQSLQCCMKYHVILDCVMDILLHHFVLCEGNPPVTSRFPWQRASRAWNSQ